MKSPKMMVRTLAVAVCAVLVFSGGSAAFATAVTTSSSPSSAPVSSSSGDCNGSSAFKSISYTVNGKSVSTLSGNAAQGATVLATFVLKSGCDNTAVGIASYQAKSANGQNQPFSDQTLFAYNEGTFSAGTTESVKVVVPNCFYQVDVYTGTVAQPGDYYSATGRLVAAANGGTETCNMSTGATTTSTTRPSTTSTPTTEAPATTSTTTAPSTTSTTSVPATTSTTLAVGGTGETTTSTTRPTTSTTVEGGSGSTTTTVPGDTTVTVGNTTTTAPEIFTTTTEAPSTTTSTTIPVVSGTSAGTVCATNVSSRVTNYSVTVNGVTTSTLPSDLSGKTVTVNFTVAAGCKEQLSLASYNATTLDTSPTGVLSQTLFDSSTGWFMPGSYTLAVQVPNCMYQVDFVEGTVINQFGPVGTNNYYAGHILDTSVGGTATCGSTTTTTSPSVGGTSDTTPTTRPGATTTVPSDVQGESVSNNVTTSTTSPAAVEAVTAVQPALAFTGYNVMPFVWLGVMFVGLGGLLLLTARRKVTTDQTL